MRRILVLAMSTALMVTASLASPALASAQTWHIQAGSAGITGGVFDGSAGNAFYPGRIAVHAADSIVFTPVGPHTITFNALPIPLFALFEPAGGTTLSAPGQFLNSGFAVTPFTLTIGASLPPGSYAFICGLHFGMGGTIDVLPASDPLPATDAEYGALAARQIARDLATAAEIAAEPNDEDGASVAVGAGNNRVTNLRFFPSVVTIHKGQTVTFLKTHDPTEPHTVTIGPEPAGELAALLPAGGPPFVYDGQPTTLVNSGIMLTTKQYDFYHLALVGFPPPIDKIKVTFTKAGTYDYICAIHDEAGMRAKVVVLP